MACPPDVGDHAGEEVARPQSGFDRRRVRHASPKWRRRRRTNSPPTTPHTLRLTPWKRGPNSSRSTSSWGSAIQVSGFADEPVRSSPEKVSLAGLRVFLLERCGSLREAFQRMDFHHDGRVSCLEFQEVVGGQERYCDLREARELFCMLARGTNGWLTWDIFRDALAPHVGERAVLPEALCAEQRGESPEQAQGGGDTESRGSWASYGTSETNSSRAAGNALRSLLFGRAGLDCKDISKETSGGVKRADNEFDELATTVQTMTPRSSHSGLVAPHFAKPDGSLPKYQTLSASTCADWPSESNVKFKAEAHRSANGVERSSPACQSFATPSRCVTSPDARDCDRNDTVQTGSAVERALSGGTGEMTRWLLDGLSCDSSPSAFGVVTSNAQDSSLVSDDNSRGKSASSQTSVMQQLDESLNVWRTEVAALQRFAASCNPIPTKGVTALETPAMHSGTTGSPSGACGSWNALADAQPGMASDSSTANLAIKRFSSSSSAFGLAFSGDGLLWLQYLPYHMQGRLAACRNAAEALEILDEALDGLPVHAADQGRAVRRPHSSCGRWRRRNESRPRHEPLMAPRAHRDDDPANAVPIVTASADLLRNARARVAGLEEQLRERQRLHEQRVAELCRHHRRERKQMLHGLLTRLSPPAQVLSRGASPGNPERSFECSPLQISTNSPPGRAGLPGRHREGSRERVMRSVAKVGQATQVHENASPWR